MLLRFEKPLILASASPRRQELLTRAGLSFTVLTKNVDEEYPTELQGATVAEYIARKKASAYDSEVHSGSIIITADTIVVVDEIILGKPSNEVAAREMLQMLSGRTHQVITAVCIRSRQHMHCFSNTTKVRFRKLEESEIKHYVENYKPFDKAGGYGIQEWIGHIGIESIEGSYDNVVGLPVAALWSELQSLKSAGLI
ncbi:MAG: Maf family nucleotide pyrophosphatase [Bacteroidota bacterium]